MNNIQPNTKNKPPTGVINPNPPSPTCPPDLSITSKYKEPLNNTVPVMKQIDAHLKAFAGRCVYIKPDASNASP
jgi:hypothetical protein